MANNPRFLEGDPTRKGIPPLAARQKKNRAQRMARRIRRQNDKS